MYETRHRPLLRLVSVGELMLHDDRVGAVALADREDVPLAQLGVLLAPALVLTRDTHLLSPGIGVREWADALVKLKELMELEQAAWSVADGVVITGGLTFYGVRGLVRVLLRSDFTLGLTLAAGLALGYLYGDQSPPAPDGSKSGRRQSWSGRWTGCRSRSSVGRPPTGERGLPWCGLIRPRRWRRSSPGRCCRRPTPCRQPPSTAGSRTRGATGPRSS